LMLTTQTAQHHAIAGASETAGLLVFRPRERSPTQQHQAPSRLQRCAPSRLSTISGAAEPKSLSRPASSSLDRPQYPLSEPADHLRQAGASFRTRGGEARAYVSLVSKPVTSSALPNNNGGSPPKSRLIFRSLRVHTCSRQPVLVRSYLNAVIPALHLFCISQNFLRRYTASQQ